jgi:hypothetical protein
VPGYAPWLAICISGVFFAQWDHLTCSFAALFNAR